MSLEEEILKYGRPMYMDEMPKERIQAKTGTELECKNWDAEAALRMLNNNLNPDVAVDSENLIVYGGSGRAVRNWREYNKIVETLKKLDDDETLCVQSGKAVYVAKTHKDAPRIVIANSNIVPHWANQKNFEDYDRLGLTMYGQMTAGSWIYIGTQGIIQGTYETLNSLAKKEFNSDSLKGKFILTSGMGGMSGAQPLAAKMNGAVILDVEVRKDRILRKQKERYCDFLVDRIDDALKWVECFKIWEKSTSIGLVGNAADVYPELVKRNFIPDIVTDQTPAHDLLSYVPSGNLQQLDELRYKDPEVYKKRSLESIAKHVSAILDMQKKGAIAFDYGNNLRQQAEIAGLNVRNEKGEFLYPGFVPAYIRPLFCEGKGPFRWAFLSGEVSDLYAVDKRISELFPSDTGLKRWIELSQKNIPVIGLPSRICWLSYGDRLKAGILINEMVKDGVVKAPVVIGRDHLDSGSVASPNRETEGMLDGSDAIADWPLLNFALNSINGASWVSFHHGGGVGIGYSLHAGMVVVCDGTKEREKRLERVLTCDPGIGVARHVDAGYERAIEVAKEKDVKIPRLNY